MPRPLGVSLLAILSLVSGAWGIVKGLIWLGLGGVVAGGLATGAHPLAGALVGLVAVVFGGIALATGIFSLIFAFGAFGVRPWAWTLGVLTHGAIVAWSVVAVLGPARLADRWVTLAVSGVIVYYLTTPAIKQAFGRA
jgi:hypothetical protein